MLGCRTGLIAAACSLLVVILAVVALKRDIGSQQTSKFAATRVRLRLQRWLATDLEIGGQLDGVPAGNTRYVAREDLLALPRMTYRVGDDPNFAAPTDVTGILLENLPHALGAASTANLVIAICDDKYHANYPEEYLARHHPLLVLEVNGQPPSGWPKDSGGHGFAMGPYMISHTSFTPSWKILSHAEEAQIPWGVERLEFRDQESVFGRISPLGPARSDPEVLAGYKIAQQNCFRCHNLDEEGGQKSAVPWQALAQVAAASATWFSAHVRDPKSKNPRAEMPGNPEYDAETLSALVSYFRTFRRR